MGFFGDLIRIGAPIVGGALFGPAGAAAGAGIAGYIGSRSQAGDQQRAGAQAAQTAMGGFNYLQNSPIGTTYAPAGANALNQQQAMLGLMDPNSEQSRAAYSNYLNSIGYRSQMAAGQQAITTSAAARGLLGSGSTAKALTRFGQDHAARSFDNYLAHLGGISQMGLQAGNMLGNAAQQGYGQAAQYQFGSGQRAADTRASGWDQLLGGLGAGYDAWQAGRAKTPASTVRIQPNPASIGRSIGVGMY